MRKGAARFTLTLAADVGILMSYQTEFQKAMWDSRYSIIWLQKPLLWQGLSDMCISIYSRCGFHVTNQHMPRAQTMQPFPPIAWAWIFEGPVNSPAAALHRQHKQCNLFPQWGGEWKSWTITISTRLMWQFFSWRPHTSYWSRQTSSSHLGGICHHRRGSKASPGA